MKNTSIRFTNPIGLSAFMSLMCICLPVNSQALQDGDEKTHKISVDYVNVINVHRKDHPDAVLSVDISQDGKKIISGCDDGLCQIYELSPEKLVETIDAGRDQSVSHVAFSHDGKLALYETSRPNSIVVWDIGQKKQKCKFERKDYLLYKASFSSDDTKVIFAYQPTTSSSDLFAQYKVGIVIATLETEPKLSLVNMFSSTRVIGGLSVYSEKIVVGFGESGRSGFIRNEHSVNSVQVWDAKLKSKIMDLDGPYAWAFKHKKRQEELTGVDEGVSNVVLTPNNSGVIAIFRDGSLHKWIFNKEDGAKENEIKEDGSFQTNFYSFDLKKIPGNENGYKQYSVHSMAIGSKKGSLLALAGGNWDHSDESKSSSFFALIDSDSGAQTFIRREKDGYCFNSVALSADGKRLAVARTDGAVTVYDIK